MQCQPFLWIKLSYKSPFRTAEEILPLIQALVPWLWLRSQTRRNLGGMLNADCSQIHHNTADNLIPHFLKCCCDLLLLGEPGIWSRLDYKLSLCPGIR